MVNERKLSKAELSKREDIIMNMKDNKRDLVKKYGKDAEAVMYGRATNMAKKQTKEMRDPKLTELIKDALKNPKKADLNKDGKLSDYEKKRGSAIEKNISEDLDLGHEDNEPHMLKSDLYHIGKCAMNLYNTLDQFDDAGEVDLPSWWQSKIFKAKEALVGAEQYLDFELNEPKIDAVVDVAVDVVDETVEDFITSVDDLDEGSKYSSLAEKLAKELKESVNEGMSKEALYSQIRDIIDSLDSGESDGEPLTNETEMLLQQELHRLRKIYKSLKEGLPKGYWDKNIDAEDEVNEFDDKSIKAYGDAVKKSYGAGEDLKGLMAQGEKMAAFANKQSGYEGGVSSPVRGVLAAATVAGAPDFNGDEDLKAYWTRRLTKAIETQKDKKYMSGFSVDESYATVVNKIKKSGKSEKAAKAIAGAVASYKAKGGGKGPTAKQK